MQQRRRKPIADASSSMFDESEMALSAVGGDNSATVLDDDYALIEHQLEKQRQLESQKKRKDRLTGEAFIAHQVQNACAPQGKSYFLPSSQYQFAALNFFLLSSPVS